MPRSLRREHWLLSLLLCLSSLTGCDRLTGSATPAADDAEHTEHDSTLQVTEPLRRDVVIARQYVAQVRANQHIELRALERGYVQEVTVKEGELVQPGRPLFKIQPLTYLAELRRAQAEGEVARLEYENTKRLANSQIVSQTELQLSKAKFDKAQAEVSLAQAHLGFTEIHAPFAGLVDRLEVRKGSLAEEGDLLTTLSDNSQMWVYFNVPEVEYLEYSTEPGRLVGQTVMLTLANGKPYDHPGRITAIEAAFNNETGTIAMRADFPNPDRLLRHGQTGNVQIDVPIAGALLIPQKSTFEVLDHHYVFVLGENDVVEQRRVRLAGEMEDLFLVSDGLTEHDRIVFEGLRQARNGKKAEYRVVPPEEAFANLKVPTQ